MKQILILMVAALIALAIFAGLDNYENNETINQLENKIEALESSNSVLQQERDELHKENEQYKKNTQLIDENWHWKNNQAKDHAQ